MDTKQLINEIQDIKYHLDILNGSHPSYAQQRRCKKIEAKLNGIIDTLLKDKPVNLDTGGEAL